ncbi:hypothetical protein CF327_g2806 [Tilletia walkeri]|nr:hypothetical protein CF327_g2806 [Tilletia walkeri]
MPSPFATEAEICAKSTCFLPAQSMTWIPVDVACLAPGVDYMLHPRLTVTPDEAVQLARPTALATNRTSHVLLANYGSAGIHLARHTPVADARAAHLGDASGSEAHSFDLPPPLPPGALLHTMGTAESWSAAPGHDYALDDTSPAAPPDLHEEAPAPPGSLMVEAATKIVDGHFKVGMDSAGRPHPEVVELLRRHEPAFALDGRPGLVHDEEMAIPLVPGAVPHAEPPRRASPEKRAAMDAALDQLLEWDVVEPSSSPASFPVLMVRQNTKWRFCVDYRH